MKKSKMFISVLLTFVLVMMLRLNVFSQDKPIELRLAHMTPVGSPSDEHIKRWAEKIASDSNGRLKIRIFPVNTLIPGPEIYDGVAKGAADIGFTWRYKPEGFSVGVTFPFILGAPDTVTASRVYDDIWKKFPKVMAEEWKDVKILYIVPSVPNQLFIAKKPLRRVEDLKGLQLRVPSKDAADFVKELGATPVFMSVADCVIGIEKGTVDGAFLVMSVPADYKLRKTLRYVLPYNIGIPPVKLFMNKDSFNKLSADLQGVLDKSCEWAKDDALKYWSATVENANKYYKTEGMEFVSLSGEEKAKLVAIYGRVCDKIGTDLDAKGYPGTEIVRFIRERVEHYARK